MFADYLSILKQKLESSVNKEVSCLFLVVPEVTPFLQSFFDEIAISLSIPIELISSAASMCLSYGFFDHNIKKQVLLLDFGWQAVRMQAVLHDNNEYKLGPRVEISALSGKSLYSELTNVIESQIVGNDNLSCERCSCIGWR